VVVNIGRGVAREYCYPVTCWTISVANVHLKYEV
jgi:hypothetical protein